MGPAAVVEGQVAADRSPGVGDGIVGAQVDLFILDRSPEPLEEDVVPPRSPPSMLMAMPLSRSSVVKAMLVNWLPWTPPSVCQAAIRVVLMSFWRRMMMLKTSRAM